MSWTNQRNRNIAILLTSLSIVVYSASFYFRNVGLLLVATGTVLTAVSLHFQRITSFGISAVALCLSLAAAECVAPLFFTNEKKETDVVVTFLPKNIWKRSDDLGALGNAGIYTVRAQSLSGETIYDVKYSIGEDGFRITPGVENGHQRINFLGDSGMFGLGLNDNETLPYFINQRIRNISVKNWGIPAYGAHQALAILESDRDTKGAINFLVTGPWHAVRSSCKPIWTAGSPKYEMRSNGALVRVGHCSQGDELGVFRKLLSQSRLYSVAEKIWRDSTSDGDLELYFAIIKQVAEMSRHRGQTFIIGFAKAEESFFKGTSYTNEKVFVKLKEMSDEIIDLTLADRVENVDARYFLHRLDRHPSALANGKTATMLVDTFNRHLR